jgi:hypothetical protein
MNKDALILRVEALPPLPSVSESAEALNFSVYRLKTLIENGVVEAKLVGKTMRPTRKSLRRLAEQYG